MKPLVLTILDGFGWAPPSPGNAITNARTPHFDEWYARFPHTTLRASGLDVGLPEGTQGTSEAGHITIGAGRVVFQPSVAIDLALRNGTFYQNAVLLNVMNHVKQHNATLHLLGMCSDAGVHAHIDHLIAALRMAHREGVRDVAIHMILDGRDVPEKSALQYIAQIETACAELQMGKIASMVGRYFAMDRDTNWDRTEQAYNLLVYGNGHPVATPAEGISLAYARGDRSDYYIEPTVVVEDGAPVAVVKDRDAVFFTNFRSDRARQITYTFTEHHFEGFARASQPHILFAGMSTYDREVVMPAAYPQEVVQNNLAHVLADAGLRQFRTAETEKYAHVTFFFNSQEEDPVPGEERELVHSPKVPSYDAVPEMNARGVTDQVLHALSRDSYSLIVANFANPDLVGHSANLAATITAIECIDARLGEIWDVVRAQGGIMMITGDHGNAEYMIDKAGRPCPAHSLNPVPFLLLSEETPMPILRTGGALGDIAPTILQMLGIDKPAEMTGQSLL